MLGDRARSLFIVLAVTGSLSPETVSDRVDELRLRRPVRLHRRLRRCSPVALFPGPAAGRARRGCCSAPRSGRRWRSSSATLGASLACSSARFVAGDAVEEIGGPRIKALAAWVGRARVHSRSSTRASRRRCPTTSSTTPAGLTTIPLGVVRRGDRDRRRRRATFAYVALGGSFGDFCSPEAIIAIVIIVGMGLIGLLLIRRDFLRERASREAAPPQDDPLRAPDVE